MRRSRRHHKKIAPKTYEFDAVRPGDAHGAAIWEYARLSAALRKGFQGAKMLFPERVETKFLTAIRVILGPEKFLEEPWIEVLERLREDMPEFKVEPVAVQPADYPVKLVQGTEVHPDANHLVVTLDLRFAKGAVLDAISRMYDHYQPLLPSPSPEGRPQDWMARLVWLGWYRLHRAGYTYREIAALCHRETGMTDRPESIARSIKRGVSNVPGIFHDLFPFLQLKQPIRKPRTYL